MTELVSCEIFLSTGVIMWRLRWQSEVSWPMGWRA
ncbi:hypothetical protein COLO4_12973 [Corchorus olitorius]|uniref:Uncharacterized protein n=1 Tax=Corchorus olitorius TaxID=93759 RepID=A0A1R3JYV1_9ROSI|nr:hypothetical protein COLO4_12973 [Corchorus olitorius]